MIYREIDPYSGCAEVSPGAMATNLQTVTTSGGLRIEAATVSDPSLKDTLLMMQPWSQYVARPDIVRQLPEIAAATGKNIVVTDYLGLGAQTSPIPPAMSRDFRRGNFAPLVTEQEEVIAAVCPTLGALSIVGYSEGANMAAVFLANAQSCEAHAVALIEATSIEGHSFGRLVGRFACEAVRKLRDPTDDYSELQYACTDHRGSAALTLHGLYDYPRGIVQRDIFSDIRQAAERERIAPGATIAVAHGSRSIVSPMDENARFARKIDQLDSLHTVELSLQGVTHVIADYPAVLQRTFEAVR